jgi:hypothetical protein
MTNIESIIEKLPPSRRAKIEGRARELIGQKWRCSSCVRLNRAPWLPPESPRAEITIGKRRREGE